MADKRDYYEVLGIDKSASADDIKKAYRKKAKEYPPRPAPRRQGARGRSSKRSTRPTRCSPTPISARSTTSSASLALDPNSSGAVRARTAAFGGFDDILDDRFGGFGLRRRLSAGGFGGFGGRPQRRRHAARRRERPHSGAVTFEEAGLRLPEGAHCHQGREPATECKRHRRSRRAHTPETCPDCQGTRHRHAPRSGRPSASCPAPAPCSRLRRHGQDHQDALLRPAAARAKRGAQRKIKVSIPAGIDDGQTISLRGAGQRRAPTAVPRAICLITVSASVRHPQS